MNKGLPKWADVVLIPLLSLLLAFLVSGLVVMFIGKDPIQAVQVMVSGALGKFGIGYTLYYTTNFIFTGLAVAIAFHARMFNIGGEGQAGIGGVGVAAVLLSVAWPHWTIAIVAASLGAMAFGAAWAAIPAYLQAKRGSHIVITTIMFNWIGSALIVYLLVGPMQAPGMVPETVGFSAGAAIPTLHDIFPAFDKHAPANVSLFLALIAAFAVWVLVWKTRLGYEIRAFGHSEKAAVYAGISPLKIIMVVMLISGGLAGMMAVNTVQGEAERLILDTVQGAGFVGIAVALMGRSHPVGVVLAAFLFGILYQGGGELSFEMGIPREMIVVIQALVIMFVGSLENMVRIPVERLFVRFDKGAA
ncbi:sugar ABC transporter permease [Rhodobacterales bacterium 52_120_T64]|nr:sugar ABC transporter permease [Rhodobacterales bacterium 52_120_T64]